MPAKFNFTIPKRNVELIRDRIGLILIEEFDNQYENYNPECQVNVYVERRKPNDQTELNFINVSLLNGESINKHQSSKDFIATYAVDVCTSSKTTAEESGDKLSQILCTRLLMICDYILEDPQYKTLGFNAPFLSVLGVQDFTMFNQDERDSNNIAIGRILVKVRINENNSLLEGNNLLMAETKYKITQTDKGLQFVYQ